MNNKKTLIIFLAALLPAVLAAEVNTTGADFLKIPVGARTAAMGEAVSALTFDSEALDANVAGMIQLRSMQALFEHSEWIENVRREVVQFAMPLNFFGGGEALRGVAGLNLQFLGITPFEHYDSWGLVVDQVKYSAFKVKAGYALDLVHNESLDLSAGLSFSFVSKSMNTTGSGIDADTLGKPSIDVGGMIVLYHHNSKMDRYIGESINVSLLFQNIDFIRLAGNENLPFLMRLGVGVKLFQMVDFGIDVFKYSDSSFRAGFGAEYWFRNLVAIRAGAKLGTDQLNHFTVGLGAKYTVKDYTFNFDYALIPFESFGLTHRFSLKFDLGKYDPRDMTDIYYYKGVDYFMQNDYKKAIDMWDKVLKKRPDHPEAAKRIKEARKVLELEEKQKKLNELETDVFSDKKKKK